MKTLWFVVPVHGRVELAAVCLRQLRRTCDAINKGGDVYASAVVVADHDHRERLKTLLGGNLGFGSVTRDNAFLSRRFNDGIQLATDPVHNPRPADYVVPCGSDDWVDHRLFLDLPDQDTIVGFQRISFVREDGREMVTAEIDHAGGWGIRIIPRQLLVPLGYRPADEDRYRGCDISILRNLRLTHGDRLRIQHRHLHDRQIVDWKTPTTQLNSFRETVRMRHTAVCDPFTDLAGVYPDESLAEMEAHYHEALVAA